jgi:hypothetical protein
MENKTPRKSYQSSGFIGRGWTARKVVEALLIEPFSEFKTTCEEFFQNSSQYLCQLRSLLADNFQIIRV